MICTVTFNPSLDYIVSVSDFKLGMTNRTDSELILPGGKGINVSTILKNLGIGSTALGFTAGFTGREISQAVERMGIRSDFIPVENGISRINVKLKNIDGTEINGMGPEISPEKVDELMRKLDVLGEGDVLVLAGSIPASMPDDMYSRILESVSGRGVIPIVDATKDLLLKVLRYRPFLIKPNHHELGEIFQQEIRSREEALAGANVVMGLRIQLERMHGGLFPSLSEYAKYYGVAEEHLRYADKDCIVMHPGPVNRGVELTSDVIDADKSKITEQVLNGVAVRMALLFLLVKNRQGGEKNE